VRRPAGKDGFALIAVLWGLVVMGSLALHFHATARPDRQIVANAATEARVRWAARGGLSHGRDALSRSLERLSGPLPLLVGSDTLLPVLWLTEAETRVEVVVLDARGRLNANLAAPGQLLRLFTVLGVPERDARRLADAIVAARRQRGVWTAEPAAGRTAFTSLGELRQLPEMTPDLYRAVGAHLTVTGDGRINLNSATRPVLLTLPEVDASTADAIIRRRRERPYGNVYELLAELPPHRRAPDPEELADLLVRISFSPRDVEVVSTAWLPHSAMRAQHTAAIRLGGGASLTLLNVIER
jgi:type II secretory pathway component PulK